MTLRIVDTIALVPLAGDLPRSRIIVDGHDTGAIADGVVLEAAVAADGRHLLFVTDDVPYEEALHVQLFDREWTPLDRADFGWMYATGNFRDLALIDDARLRFTFFDDGVMLELFERPARAWFSREPKGVHRRFGSARHFGLSVAAPR